MPSSMRLASVVLLILFLINLNLFQTACSLDRKTNSGLQIKLAPSRAENMALAEFFSLAATPTSLSQLNCFFVNARGGDISTSPVCSGTIQKGIIDGMRSGIGSVFQLPNVPIGDGIVFEAFGISSPNGCPDVSASAPQPDASASQVFGLGSLPTNADALTKVVTIPVAFSATNTFPCNSGPYQVFADDFSAYTTSGFLHSVASSTWSSMTNAAAGFSVFGGGLDVGLTATNSGDNGRTNATAGKPFYSVSVAMAVTTMTGGATANFVVGAGLEDVSGFTGADALGCSIGYTAGGGIASATLVVGGMTNPTVPLVGTAGTTNLAGISTPSGIATMTCEFRRQSNGSFTAIGHIIDNAGHDTATSAFSFSDPCTASGCVIPYISMIKTASVSGDIFGIRVLQADTPQ